MTAGAKSSLRLCGPCVKFREMWMWSAGVTATRNRIFFLIYVVLIAIGVLAAYDWLELGKQGAAFKAGTLLVPFGLWMLWVDFIALDCK